MTLTNTLRLVTLLQVAILASSEAAAAPDPVRSPVAIDPDAIDQYIAAQMINHDLRGVSLAIIDGDQVLYLRGYGSAGKDRPMTPQTPMYVGSQSKSFAATQAPWPTAAWQTSSPEGQGVDSARLVECGIIGRAFGIRWEFACVKSDEVNR